MEWLYVASLTFIIIFLYFSVQMIAFAFMARVAKSEYVRAYHRKMQEYSFWASIFFGWCGIIANAILIYLAD